MLEVMEPIRPPRFWLTVAVVVLVWLVLALFLTGQGLLLLDTGKAAQKDLAGVQPSVTFLELFLNNLVECILWAIFTLIIFWLGRRFPFGQGKWPRSLIVHWVACIFFAMILTLLAVVTCEMVRNDLPKPTISANVMRYFFIAKLNNNIFFYWAIVAVSQVLNFYRQWRDREVRASQLEAKLAQTQLQILKMQLHPHFLFNTLNAISALIHQDVDLADRMIARLGDLLRATLE